MSGWSLGHLHSKAGMLDPIGTTHPEYAVLLHNVVSASTLEDITPEKAWGGNKPDVSRYRAFGSRTSVHIPDAHRSKLTAKPLVCTFLGHAQSVEKPQGVPSRPQPYYPSLPESCGPTNCDVIIDGGCGAPRTSFEHVFIESDGAEKSDAEAGIAETGNASSGRRRGRGRVRKRKRKREEIENVHRTCSPSPRNPQRHQLRLSQHSSRTQSANKQRQSAVLC